MNNVSLVGRIARDPEVRYTPSQVAVARFTVACNRPFTKEGEQSADFISCVAFGKVAEFIERYFTKGMPIGITGRIQTGSYTDQSGNKVYTTNVVADRVEFVGNKQDSNRNVGSSRANAGYEAAADMGYDIPEGFSALEDDDLPF